MDTEILLWIFGGVAVYLLFIKVKKDKDGRVEDSSVTLDMVVEALEEFDTKSKPAVEGFTEAQIQKRLFEHLNKYFVHVNKEQGVEGVNGLKVDFDIGRGKVGIEVKLARSLFKTAGLQRLEGQVKDYMKNKYHDDNLIVAVFGTSEEAKERVYLTAIKERIDDIGGAKYLFIKVKTTPKLV